jgi:hypothetical protein
MDDPAIASWFLGEGDRANPATDLRAFTTGNLVQPLVDGRSYFARLCAPGGTAFAAASDAGRTTPLERAARR